MDVKIGFHTLHHGCFFLNGAFFKTGGIFQIPADRFPVAVLYFPFNVSTPLVPLAFELKWEQTLKTESKNVTVTRWAKDTFELTVAPQPCFAVSLEEPKFQRAFDVGERTILVTLCEDFEQKLFCDWNGQTRIFRLPRETFSIRTEERCGVFYLLAQSKNYLFVLNIDEGLSVCYDDAADECEWTEFLKIKRKLTDTAEHMRSEIYRFTPQGMELWNRSVYPTKKVPENRIPVAFFEALKLGLKEESLSYLSDDLTDAYSSLKEYFGEYDTAEIPKLIFAPSCVALRKEDTVRLIRVSMKNKKIDNFSDYDNGV